MGRMDMANQDDTRATRNFPEQPSQASDLGETRPSSRSPDQAERADLSQTVPTPLDHSRNQMDHNLDYPPEASAGQAQTVPTPVRGRPAGVEVHPQSAIDGKPGAQAFDSQSPPPAMPPTPTTRRLPSWRLWTLLGILALALIAFSSGLAGYRSGILKRTQAEAAQVSQRAQSQYELGLQDLEAGNFARARQRFEYVISLDPGYPGAAEKLAEVLMRMNSTATPTVAPTPTVTPTPDTRNVDELFTQAQQHLNNSDWTAAIDTLLSLRKADVTYQPVWVDDMLYVSLRNRGKDKILRDGDLEGGIYDLTLAERFGPLDVDARGYLTWAELYLRGASFWELDWSQAVYYFGQVAPALPNLRDGSGMTATERYRRALVGYGDQFAREEDWCNAMEQYEVALTVGTDPDVETRYAEAAEKCAAGVEVPEAPVENPEGVPTATLPAEITPVPTETLPAEVTPIPTEVTPVPTQVIPETPAGEAPTEAATPTPGP